MNRKSIYHLSVHFFPRAVEAGVVPVEANNLPLCSDWQPCHYKSHTFEFEYPPTRDDFKAVIHSLPWASWMRDEIFPCLDRSQFPLVDWMHKAGSTDLLDDKGQKVGRMEVYRHDLHQNKAAAIPAIHCDTVKSFLGRRTRGPVREKAKEIVQSNEHWIRERVMALATEEEGWDEQTLVTTAIEELLVEKGILTAK